MKGKKINGWDAVRTEIEEEKHRVERLDSQRRIGGQTIHCGHLDAIGWGRWRWFGVQRNARKETNLAMFLWTKISPGRAAVMTESGTRESAHPIQKV